ncbi:sigma-70 family RNA polymerase sigma factor [Ekhidna sp.]|uniref:RNA polymerase sigma factor n=1 Tax=Ekhidna sp. TaxID=2608089 RepID=UPI00329998A0
MISIEFLRNNSDDTIIDGLRKGKKKTIKEVYENFYPYVKSHILKNSGSEDDAKDVFQDAMMAIFQNVSNKEFELTCQFKTYLHAVSSNIWKKRLRERKNHPLDTSDEIHNIAQEELEDTVLKIDRYNFYIKKFNEISEKCQEILKLFLNGVDMKRIAAHFGFASVSYAKKRKFQCKESLIKAIENDPEYKLLVSNE